jgi:hypothetical protein
MSNLFLLMFFQQSITLIKASHYFKASTKHIVATHGTSLLS